MGKGIFKYTLVYYNFGVKLATTTIKIHDSTKSELNNFKEYKNESYDEVLGKIIYIAKTAKSNPKLSQKTVKEIEKARKRINAGKFLTEAQAKKSLGI